MPQIRNSRTRLLDASQMRRGTRERARVEWMAAHGGGRLAIRCGKIRRGQNPAGLTSILPRHRVPSAHDRSRSVRLDLGVK